MTDEKLNEIEAKAHAALPYERSILREDADGWEAAESGEDSEGDFECPLCSGEGHLDGQRFDAKPAVAATIVAFGIGAGLRLAEEYVERGPTDTLALVAEVRRLRAVEEAARRLLEEAALACEEIGSVSAETSIVRQTTKCCAHAIRALANKTT